MVGIGFVTDKKSAQNVESSIDGIKDKALQLGGIVAGAFGANALTFGFANTYDALGKLGERWGLAAEDVAAYDRAIQHAGGSSGEFFGSLQRLTQLQTASPQTQSSFIAGVAPEGIASQVQSVLSATDALEGFLRSADALNQLDPDRQERFIQAIGFSDSEVRLLRSGREGILGAVNAEKQLLPITKEMTDAAALFNDETKDLVTNASGFQTKVAAPITGAIGGIVAGMNDWISANREILDQFAEFSGNLIADNIEIIAGAFTILGAGATISALKTVAGLVAGISGSLIAGAAAAAPFVAAFAILTEGGKGEKFGSGTLFGENAVTNFLDTPLSEFFKPSIEQVATPSSYIQGVQQQSQSGYGQRPIQVTIPVSLDGQIIETKVLSVLDGEADQAVQDLTVSEGG